MRFFKWLYIDIWIPANWYFSVFFTQIAQFKIVLEIMVFVGAIYLYFFGSKFTTFQLGIISIVFFLAGTGIGKALVKLGVPQKGNHLGNLVNPQMLEILERLKRIEEKIK